MLAIAEQGCLLNAPDVYMDKLAIGPGYADGTIDLARSPSDNIRSVAKAKGVDPSEIIVCVLDRPRHADLIAELRGLGCGIKLIPDGDVAGVIDTTDTDTGVDVYMGTGGAPEGVLAAAALRCVGGQIQGRLLFRNDDEIARARRWGIEDLDRIYTIEDMAKRRLHLRRHRSDRRLAARRRPSPQGLRHDREHRHAGELGHGPPRGRRAPPLEGLSEIAP